MLIMRLMMHIGCDWICAGYRWSVAICVVGALIVTVWTSFLC